MTDIEAEIKRLSKLGYHRLISGEPSEGYLAEVLELEGCATAGETPEEALRNLDEAMAAEMLAGMEPIAEQLAASGQYSPRVEVDPDASVQERLLAVSGRHR